MTKSISRFFKGSLVAVCLFFTTGRSFADLPPGQGDVPRSASHVWIDSSRILHVQKPSQSEQPFVIKGVDWNPATRSNSFFLNDPGGYLTFKRDEIFNHFQQDIPLIHQMNANVVRVYTDFGFDGTAVAEVLDELYRNGIMVVMVAASTRNEMETRYEIYSDANAADNHFLPSGWTGDYAGLTLDDNVAAAECGRMSSCIRVGYGGNSWGGIFWQNIANNWGSQPGENLTGFNKLVFKARGVRDGQAVPSVQVGGITNDTAKVVRQNIALTTQWQEFSINLNAANLSDIRGGFFISLKYDNGQPQTVYLDDIAFVYDPALGGTPPANVTPHFEQVVNMYKNHPAILAWLLGNEWNVGTLYFGYLTTSDAADATNKVAQWIKTLDPNHPVASSLGEPFGGQPPGSILTDIIQRTPAVDLWAMQIYRGSSFADFFDRWQQITTKPFFFSEFGVDSFMTDPASIPPGLPQTTAIGNITGHEDQAVQRDYDLSLLREIKNHLQLPGRNEFCLGGTIFAFNDMLYRVGNYFENLGGLVNYATDHSYDAYNPGGFLLDSYPDGVSNEEYWGLVDADRHPKLAFSEVQGLYQWFEDVTPPTGSIVINGGASTTSSTAVLLTLAAMDNESGVAQMQLSEDGVNWRAPESFVTGKDFLLSSTGAGMKTVYAKFADAAGNWSDAVSVTIRLLAPIGSACTQGTDCVDPGICYLSVFGTSYVCSNGLPPNMCRTSKECAQGYFCNTANFRCSDGSLNSFCNKASECKAPYFCSSATRHCTTDAIGAICANSTECPSGMSCGNNVCAPALVAIGQPCGAGTDCVSTYCDHRNSNTSGLCSDGSRGSFCYYQEDCQFGCDSSKSPYVCRGKVLGAVCAQSSECDSGNCDGASHTCANVVGGACSLPSDCPFPMVCTPVKTCGYPLQQDTTPPTVAITSPVTNVSIGQGTTVTVAATASDNIGVQKVDFYLDGTTLLATATSSPYQVSPNTSGVAVGAHTLTAKAFDRAGNTATSAAANIIVADTTPPAVAITGPLNNTTVAKGKSIKITATATDNVGVAKVEFYVNNSPVATQTAAPYSYVWEVPKKSNVKYTLQAKAYDAKGNVGISSGITVTAK